jgi:hypothetical protein
MVHRMVGIFETSVSGTCMQLGIAQASRDFVKRQRFIKPQRFIKGQGFIKGQIGAGLCYSQRLI